MWDVIVAGLGPAGSTAARIAAAGGLRVLGVDRSRFPRHKPCAAGITVRAAQLLELEEADYLEVKIRNIILHMGMKNAICVNSATPMMVTSRRDVLDTELVRLAQAAGVRIQENFPVTSVRMESGGITVMSPGKTEKTRFLIGCDGVNSVVRRAVTGNRLVSVPAWETELEKPVSVKTEENQHVHFELGTIRRGYGWIFPKKSSVSVGVAGDLKSRSGIRSAFEGILRRVPGMNTWPVIRESGHLLPVFRQDYPVSGDGIILAGDAAGLVDLFLGEGLYYALASGECAGKWVVSNADEPFPDYRSYRTGLMKRIGRELLIAKRLAHLVYSIPEFFFTKVAEKPFVLNRFAHALSRVDGYAGFVHTLPLPWRLLFWNV